MPPEAGIAGDVDRCTSAYGTTMACMAVSNGRQDCVPHAPAGDLVLILASDRAANVTDADITIDDGLIPTWRSALRAGSPNRYMESV